MPGLARPASLLLLRVGVERRGHPRRGRAPVLEGLGEVEVGLGLEDALGGAPIHVFGELLEKSELLVTLLHAFDGAKRGMRPPFHLSARSLDALSARLPRLALACTGEQGTAAARLPFELLHRPALGLEAPLHLADAGLGLRAQPLGVVLGRLLAPQRPGEAAGGAPGGQEGGGGIPVRGERSRAASAFTRA